MKQMLRTIELRKVECVCPACGVIYETAVEIEYLNSPFIWTKADYPVTLCDNCRASIISIDNK